MIDMTAVRGCGTIDQAFYSYTAPEPDGLADRPLEPTAARWLPQRGSHLAVLPYDAVRRSPTPHEDIQTFFAAAYRAGADLAGWPAERECDHGITDPLLA
ncbi:DUF5996 family protein [Peterkaempfera bronchialis]|uniref:Uncharacterized protein n=1 Tax=Peterkaempfera bronchialis TaxID=2126346 RepID=A0A345SS43_9ACTN|nr:DUF5996 family protein [Peterkaempfera bronchialis]AXI76548.1 hypothetical protein C7M71_002735 [Peterkaempfera bronchialis]